MSASIAHEVKQPLTAIVTWGGSGLRWLARQVPDVDEARAVLHKMIDAANRASVVIDELRAMFRKDDSRQTLVDVNRLILDTLSLTNHEIRAKNISVQTRLFESPTPLVLADQVQLQQVILNLIVNAIEAMNFMPDARELRITSALHDADGVIITVEDSGPGSLRKTSIKFSIRSSQPNRPAWAWDYRYAVRLSKLTADAFGFRA